MKHALGRHLKAVDAPEPHQVTIAELGPQDVGRIVCVRAERAAVVGPLDSQPTSNMYGDRALVHIRVGKDLFTTAAHWADTIYLYPHGANIQIKTMT